MWARDCGCPGPLLPGMGRKQVQVSHPNDNHMDRSDYLGESGPIRGSHLMLSGQMVRNVSRTWEVKQEEEAVEEGRRIVSSCCGKKRGKLISSEGWGGGGREEKARK